MGNCLKIQLKANVQNNELMKLDEVLINNIQRDGASVGTPMLLFMQGDTTITPIYGSYYFKEGDSGNLVLTNTSVTVPSNTFFRVYIPEGSKTKMDNTYGFYIAIDCEIDVTKVNGCSSLIRLQIMRGDVSALNPSIAARLDGIGLKTNKNKVSECLSMFTSANTINLVETSKDADTMAAIGANLPINVTTLHLPNNSTFISGSIEDFVNAYRTKKTSGSILFLAFGNTNITYNGNIVDGIRNFTVTWDANSINVVY